MIHLVSGPRNISTSLMYSFNNRNDCVAIDEPFYAHYLRQTKLKHPGYKDVLNSMSSDEIQIVKDLEKINEKTPILFIKNMASHVALLKSNFYTSVTNIFLIRDTDAVIKSFAKVIPDLKIEDIGIMQELEIYNNLVSKGHAPPIVDSGELLKNPNKVLSELCKKIEIPFDEQMLSWSAGPKNIDGIWAKYWYQNTHKSVGFSKSIGANTEPLNPTYLDLAHKAKFYYNTLFEKAIKA